MAPRRGGRPGAQLGEHRPSSASEDEVGGGVAVRRHGLGPAHGTDELPRLDLILGEARALAVDPVGAAAPTDELVAYGIAPALEALERRLNTSGA